GDSLIMSPDSRRVLRWAHGARQATVVDLETRQSRSLKVPLTAVAMAWSHDGRRIAAAGDNRVWVYDLKVSRAVLLEVALARDQAVAIEFAPNGIELSVTTRDGMFSTWPIDVPESPEKLIGLMRQ